VTSGIGKSTQPIVTSELTDSKKALAPGKGGLFRLDRSHLLIGKMPWRAMVRLGIISLIFIQVLQANWRPPPTELEQNIGRITDGYRFDLTQWEASAIGGKFADFVRRPAAGLTAEEAQELVRAHLDLARQAGELERQIEEIFSDPAVADPEAISGPLRSELAAARDKLTHQSSAVEAILQNQLQNVIQKTGLTTAGLSWPPPRLRLTEPPHLLVVSPRDRIQRLKSVDLVADLDSADRARLEDQVAFANNVSAYVTGVGGYGAWPTMVVDRFGLPWTLETIAHEWVHNYLAFHPLGWSYLAGGESVTINETVASIIGKELGLAVLETYYPDLVPPPPLPANETAEPAEIPANEPPPFDFQREMRTTRMVADSLLAQGLVEEAEAFMEARRQTFLDHGYRLRVLNQAYFAFHGSYATGPASTDPIGPKLTRLRELSPSLRDFLFLVDSMTSTEDVDRALERLEPR
jgi:hypothetical protein